MNYLDEFIVIGATLEEATWAQKSHKSHKSPEIFDTLYFMGKGHPTLPGVQISRFGHRPLEHGDKAP